MVFECRWSGLKYNADANKVNKEIQELKEITPENFVEMAKDEFKESHKCITWDIDECVRKQRLSEARSVINSIEIVYYENNDVKKEREYTIPAWESIKKEGLTREYVFAIDLVKNNNLKRQLFKSVNETIDSLKEKLNKYHNLLLIDE